MGLWLSMGPKGSILAQVKIWSMLWDKVLGAQLANEGVRKIKEQINRGIEIPFQVLLEGLVVMGKWVYLPKNKLLKDEILKEAHESWFTTHPGSTKMYRDLKEYYWWPTMKREIAKYVSRCGICQQVKIEHKCKHPIKKKVKPETTPPSLSISTSTQFSLSISGSKAIQFFLLIFESATTQFLLSISESVVT